MPTTCPSCGARLTSDSVRCDVCGLTADEARSDEALSPESVDRPVPIVPDLPDASLTPPEHLFCVSCGARSPAHARYCWQCGQALIRDVEDGIAAGQVPPAPPATDVETSSAVSAAGGRALLLVAGAVALVLLLFAATELTGRTGPRLAPGGGSGTEPTTQSGMTAEVADRVNELESRISATDDGAERLILRQALVDVLVSAAAFAQAGEVQEAVARELQTVDAWAEAGSFYLAHVLRTVSPEQPIFAARSARAFEEALALRPGDLDLKTDLATAYRYDPENPMRAVELVREVLDEDPQHARARFNYALMLAEIGRTEQAREHLQMVLEIPEVDDLVRQRAREMLESMAPAITS
jgi:ribosomal protein L40E